MLAAARSPPRQGELEFEGWWGWRSCRRGRSDGVGGELSGREAETRAECRAAGGAGDGWEVSEAGWGWELHQVGQAAMARPNMEKCGAWSPR